MKKVEFLMQEVRIGVDCVLKPEHSLVGISRYKSTKSF